MMASKKSMIVLMGCSLFVVISLILWSRPSFATDNVFSRSSLRDLKGIEVYVENISPDIERDGLTRDQIQTDVVQMLQKAGIEVFGADESHQAPGAPYLRVKVDAKKDWGTKLYAYSTHVELRQLVVLVRTPNIMVGGITWSTPGEEGTVAATNLIKIRKSVREQVDKFIEAYRETNPSN